MSSSCLATLDGDFRGHAYSIAQIERLNSEIRRGQNPRAPARSFSKTAYFSVLQQARVVHKSHNGKDPLAPGALGSQPDRERLLCNPLRPVAGDEIAADQPAPLEDGARPSQSATPRAARQAEATALGDSIVVSSAACDRTHAAGMPTTFGPTVVERDNPGLVIARQPSAQANAQLQPSERGLNPYLLGA